ncbi:MAG: polysaccharide export protein [Bradyrhizobium sp.]|nr:polysaccharide export protein [Bradyrhizobium sp.]
MRLSAITAACGLAFGGIVGASASFAQESPIALVPPAGQLRAYRINPGDEIEVYVWGEERLQRVVKVLPDGTFSFPLVGQIDALNKLPRDIEGEIARGLKSQYRDNVPQVTVTVKAATGLQFTVAGKVKAPGAFTPGRYVNVLEALTMAGGPGEFADVAGVTILRKSGGRLTAIKVRLSDVLKGNPSQRDLSGLPQLESGDTVIVP